MTLNNTIVKSILLWAILVFSTGYVFAKQQLESDRILLSTDAGSVAINHPDQLLATNATPNESGNNTATTNVQIRLNDTGIVFGGDYTSGNNSNSICTSNITDANGAIVPQDCNQGRDAQAAAGQLAKVGAGHGGFDFTKISSTGATLPASATSWSCVQDNHTGLMWEVKTDDGGIHDQGNRYRWGGISAIGRDNPNRQGDYFDDWNSLVNGANNNSLCGHNNWRVPTIKELQSIVNNGINNPSIDTEYFPNIIATTYWSSSPYVNSSVFAWTVSFSSGSDGFDGRNFDNRVRLVRVGQ